MICIIGDTSKSSFDGGAETDSRGQWAEQWGRGGKEMHGAGKSCRHCSVSFKFSCPDQ